MGSSVHWGLVAVAMLWACEGPGPTGQDAPTIAENPDVSVETKPALAPTRVVRGRVPRGKPLFPLLRRSGLSPRQVLQLVDAVRPHLDLEKKTHAGDRYQVVFGTDGEMIGFGFEGRAGSVHARRVEGRLVAGPGALSDHLSYGDVVGVSDAGGDGSEPNADLDVSDAELGDVPADLVPDGAGVNGDVALDVSPDVPSLPETPAQMRERQRREKRSAKRKADRTKRRVARLAAAERRREKASRVEGLPRGLAPLIRGWLSTEDPVRQLAIARKLHRKYGAQKTRKALARALRPKPIKSGMHKRTVHVDGTTARYVIYVPRGYRHTRAVPLHISLHGGGGNGEGTCRLRWVRHKAPRKFLLACPTSPGGTWTGPRGEKIAMAVYRDVLAHFAVRADRVTVGGISNGGTGAWHLASKYPWVWAAVVPRAGVRLLKDPWVENLRGMPAWVIHGDADHQIHVSNSRWMVEKLRGLDNEVRYTEVKGGGHKFFPDLNSKVIRWMIPKKRKRARAFRYAHTRGKEAPIAWWLSCDGCGVVRARMKSTSARTDVVVHSDKDPTGLKVWFPKGRADPRRPVRVVLNGEVVYTGKMSVSAMNVLDSFAITGDLRRMYGGAIVVY